MRVGSGGTNLTAAHSATTTWVRRKRPPVAEQSDNRRDTKKRQKIWPETKTLTPTPTPSPNTSHTPPGSTSFRFTSTKPARKNWHSNHKNKQQRGRVPSTTESVNSDRKWVHSPHDCSKLKDRVVFVSYNILGVENASKHPYLYRRVPQKFLDWDCRKKVILKEIIRYNPSILCFQEVDRFNDLNDLLQKDGFTGVYQTRTGEGRDGCAIFWKNELFILSHLESMEFKKFGLRDNVAQLCVLKMIQNNLNSNMDTQTSKVLAPRSLLVGNIHVLFNQSRGDVKLGQMRLFLEKAHKVSQEWGNIPIVLGGDLNCTPQSAMYQFVASSELDVRLHSRRDISGPMCPEKCPTLEYRNRDAARPLLHPWSDEELRLATGSEGVTQLRHPLKLGSSYPGVPGSYRTRDILGEPLATSYHSQFLGTVDYIWHTEELVPVRVLETLPIEVLKETGGLPSKNWGSDHLALACELAFADTGKEA